MSPAQRLYGRLSMLIREQVRRGKLSVTSKGGMCFTCPTAHSQYLLAATRLADLDWRLYRRLQEDGIRYSQERDAS